MLQQLYTQIFRKIKFRGEELISSPENLDFTARQIADTNNVNLVEWVIYVIITGDKVFLIKTCRNLEYNERRNIILFIQINNELQLSGNSRDWRFVSFDRQMSLAIATWQSTFSVSLTFITNNDNYKIRQHG